MNEQQFMKTMIETVKYDDIENKDELWRPWIQTLAERRVYM